MPQAIASNRSPALVSRATVCVQAARILRVTARQWGMCLEPHQPMPVLSAVRKVQPTPCGGLQGLLHSGARMAA